MSEAVFCFIKLMHIVDFDTSFEVKANRLHEPNNTKMCSKHMNIKKRFSIVLTDDNNNKSLLH